MQNDDEDKLSEPPIQDQEPRCPACGALPRVHVKFLDSKRGKMVRLYRCKCGARVWDD
jgi:lysyl-tRNA synthetase class I